MTGGPLSSSTRALAADVAARKTVPASYVVFSDGGKYYAESLTGGSDYSGTDAATVRDSILTALPNGGKVILKGGTYRFLTSSPTYTSHAPITFEGESAHLDRFYLSGGGTAPKQTIVWADDGIDAFKFGTTGIDSRNAPIVTFKNILFTGKDPATEPLGDTPNATGAHVRLVDNVTFAHFENCHFHRKEFGVKLAPAAGTEVIRVFLDRCGFSYNQFGIHHDANRLSYLVLRDIEGYLNQKSLIKVNPTYDLVADRIDDEGSSWNVAVGSHDTPIFITATQDIHLHRISVIGGKGGVTNSAFALMEIQHGAYGYSDLSDIELVGTDQRCLYLDGGSSTPYRCQMRGVYLGHDPGQATGFRGVVGDNPSVGLVAQNIGHVSYNGGQIFATTKIQIPFAVGVIRLRDITNMSPMGNLATPYDNTNNWIGMFGTSSTLTSAKVYTCQGVPTTLYLAGGTISAMTKNGQVIPYNSTLTTIYLDPGDTWSLTFSVTPTTAIVMGE